MIVHCSDNSQRTAYSQFPIVSLNIIKYCCFRCNKDFIKIEIEFVNYVRDRQEADIHILITSQRTGGGGREYTLAFIGQRDFAGVNDTLLFVSDQTDSDDDTRIKLVDILKLGLVRYIARTPLRESLVVSFKQSAVNSQQQIMDKWNKWVFSIDMNTFLNGQQTTTSLFFWGSLSARRVTEEWKSEISTNMNYSEDNFKFNGTTITSISRSKSFDSYVVKSVTDHWSFGISTEYYSSTFSNIDHNAKMQAGIEYNIYPYSESTRREFRFTYLIGPQFRNYTEETIFLKTEEKLLEEEFSISLELIKTWGTLNGTLEASHFFHDFSKNKLQLFGNLSLKIVNGLSFRMNGRISRVRNQLSLPKGSLSIDDVLLRRKELKTQYNYWGSVGLSYSFGSIYSPIVNPRFGNF